ncbi:MAG TPA: alpha/beta hydrolase [Candidatus Hydrogenedentes bacterium]|nr:alpha/beta hydrolase [Candidatus Hydrogenedentota bacterium]HPC18366.1 alpha/beta hydrolase [Candidatus Hydrogenedentota bacterium]HRT22125.1 alpha/beta hydrolase [Candidatus Hydrogenedentota bacterium]HRT66858.1 alpha/beta hydrolase [Candidatus Hydrogenedentota bacterium]
MVIIQAVNPDSLSDLAGPVPCGRQHTEEDLLKRLILGAVLAVGAAVAIFMALKIHADRHFYEGYDPDAPLNAYASEPEPVEGTVNAFGQQTPARYRRQRIEIDARPGERVPAILTLPFSADGPVPVIVLLHGSHQEKEFVEKICTPFNEAGFAMICFDQYMRGERKVEGGVTTMALAVRARCWKTVHDARRLIDYLVTRPDIARDRIYLVGASYGAITGTALLAQEKRIKAADLVVGGGNLRLLSKAPEVRRELPGWILPLAGPLLAFVLAPAEPLVHAPATAGIPVLMQNGSKDGVVIPESGKALFAALGEPKEIRWYPVNHPDREEKGEEVIKMLMDGLGWLVQRDAAR